MAANNTQPQSNWDRTTVNGLVPTDGFIGATMMTIASQSFVYEDDPSLAGAGTRALSRIVGPNLCIAANGAFKWMSLRLLQYRCEVPPGVGESMLIRFWRYRRQLDGTGYQITQVTDSVTADQSNTTFATDIHFESSSRDTIFNLETDSLAVTYVYTLGVGAIKAWRIDWDFQVVAPDTGVPVFPSDPTAWPPT